MSTSRLLSLLRSPLILRGTISRSHTIQRNFHQTIIPFNSDSLFGSITKQEEPLASNVPEAKPEEDEQNVLDPKEIRYINPKDDVKLQEFLHPDPIIAINELLTPLKKEIYLANVAKNGFFKNEDSVSLANGKSYKLKLSREEIEALEPSIYMKSYRIKSSMKKATVVLRLLRELKVKTAITQCNFTTKKIAREASDLLRRGLKDAEKFGYNSSNLYISQIWTGSDGYWSKRMEAKGRGRSGVITHRYIHIRCILKTDQTLKRLAWEKELKAQRLKERRPLNNPLVNTPIRSKVQGYYKW